VQETVEGGAVAYVHPHETDDKSTSVHSHKMDDKSCEVAQRTVVNIVQSQEPSVNSVTVSRGDESAQTSITRFIHVCFLTTKY